MVQPLVEGGGAGVNVAVKFGPSGLLGLLGFTGTVIP